MLAVLLRLRDRMVSDFLMRSRLGEYERLLESALSAGYRIGSVGGLWRLILNGEVEPNHRYMLLRHDVDTDPRTAAAMWDIDRALGVNSSYFFRLSTLAPELMADITAGGSEASYHYEELSSLAKQRGLRNRSDALAHLPEAMDRFAENIERLRTITGLPMRVVASHGDFANRRLGIQNWAILGDLQFRHRVHVDLEAYDDAFLRHLRHRYSDAGYPDYWDPANPTNRIRAGEVVGSLLVHPRHWRVDRMVNARDDIGRVIEGLRWEMLIRPRRQS